MVGLSGNSILIASVLLLMQETKSSAKREDGETVFTCSRLILICQEADIKMEVNVQEIYGRVMGNNYERES